MKNQWYILIIILLAAGVGFILFWHPGSKNPVETTSTATSTETTTGLPAPIYLSQMDDCTNFGGTVEEKDKDMGGWTAIDQWRCACPEGQTFSDGLKCNVWYQPESGY